MRLSDLLIKIHDGQCSTELAVFVLGAFASKSANKQKKVVSNATKCSLICNYAIKKPKAWNHNEFQCFTSSAVFTQSVIGYS